MFNFMPDIILQLPVRIDYFETTVIRVLREICQNTYHTPSFSVYLSYIQVEIMKSARTWEMSVVRIENDTSILEE
jgi:hypothetical protein